VDFKSHLSLSVVGFLDDCGFENQVQQKSNEDDSGDKGIEHESQGESQALSFCQRLIQLWL
jgi:hypothetical protein